MATYLSITPVEAEKRYTMLPADLQLIALKPPMFEVADSISQKYKFNKDQNIDFITQIGLVLLGFTDLKDFGDVLSDRLGIPKVTASNIAKEIDMNLFTPVRNSIMKMNAMNPPQALDEDGEGAGEQTVPIKPGAASGHIRNVLEHTPPHK